MTTAVITVPPEMDVHALAALFVDKGISGAPVVDASGAMQGVVLEEGLIVRDKKVHLPTFLYILTGFVTIGESRFEQELKKMASSTVAGIMNPNPVTLSPETSLEELATLMVEKGIYYFPVKESGKLAGVVTRKDIVRAMAQNKI